MKIKYIPTQEEFEFTFLPTSFTFEYDPGFLVRTDDGRFLFFTSFFDAIYEISDVTFDDITDKIEIIG